MREVFLALSAPSVNSVLKSTRAISSNQMTTFHIQQFGCRATQADGAALERQLLDRGCMPSSDPASADIVVLNTCTVTAAADAQARDAIRKIHAQNPARPPNRHRLLRPTRPRRTSLVTRRHLGSRQFPQTPNPQSRQRPLLVVASASSPHSSRTNFVPTAALIPDSPDAPFHSFVGAQHACARSRQDLQSRDSPHPPKS